MVEPQNCQTQLFWDVGHGVTIEQIIEDAKKENHNMIAIDYGDYCLLYCVGVMIPPMMVGVHRGQVVSVVQSDEDPLPQCILDEIERRSVLEQEDGGFDYKNIDVAEAVLMNI